VTLIAQNESGQKASRAHFVTIEDVGGGGSGGGGGGAVFSVAFSSLQIPDTLNVAFSGSCFLGGAPIACVNPQWTFGDGGTSSLLGPTHTYAAAGTYPVSFTASAAGQTDTATADVTVAAVGPGDDFQVSFTSLQVPGTLDVQFTGRCFLEGAAVTCESPQWTFGDGGAGSGVNVSHTYAAAGSYTVTFTASHDGQSDTATATVTVAPVQVLEFEVLFGHVQVPGTLEVQFTGSCFADSQPVTCTDPQWIFGDGQNGAGVTVSHTYPNAGLFQVTFTASHGGQTDSHSTTIQVQPANNIPTITSLVCTPNPILGGLVSLCLLVVADLDGDEITYQVDLLGGVGVCLDNGFGCTTTITGQVTGGLGIEIPFSLGTSLTQATTATIQAIITDSHGNVGAPITTTVQVLLNTPPVISVFACVPPVVLGGTSALCSFNLVDVDPGNLIWTVDIVGGSNACLGSGPGCDQTMTGTTNGLLSTINFALRTSPTTSPVVRLRARANDGLQTHDVEIEVVVL
jgi:PKD repeat protein